MFFEIKTTIMEISINELRELLREERRQAVQAVLTEMGLLSPYISQNKAHTLYGKSTVQRWVNEHLIAPIKDGDKNFRIRFDRSILETLAADKNLTNRNSFYRNKKT